jgi:hypothetical protein
LLVLEGLLVREGLLILAVLPMLVVLEGLLILAVLPTLVVLEGLLMLEVLMMGREIVPLPPELPPQAEQNSRRAKNPARSIFFLPNIVFIIRIDSSLIAIELHL